MIIKTQKYELQPSVFQYLFSSTVYTKLQEEMMSGVPAALVLVVWSDPLGWPSPPLQAYSYPHTALQVIYVLIHIFKKRYSVQCSCTALLEPVSEKLLILSS
jgi:hypothetical protein